MFGVQPEIMDLFGGKLAKTQNGRRAHHGDRRPMSEILKPYANWWMRLYTGFSVGYSTLNTS